MSWLNAIAAVALIIALVAMSLRPAHAYGRWLAMATIFLALVVQVYLALPKRPRPQLNLRNAGSEPVLLRINGEDLRVEPGVVAAFRFDLGDDLAIFSRADPTSTPTVIVLPSFTDEPSKPMTAEVNADDPEKVSYRVAD